METLTPEQVVAEAARAAGVAVKAAEDSSINARREARKVLRAYRNRAAVAFVVLLGGFGWSITEARTSRDAIASSGTTLAQNFCHKLNDVAGSNEAIWLDIQKQTAKSPQTAAQRATAQAFFKRTAAHNAPISCANVRLRK